MRRKRKSGSKRLLAGRHLHNVALNILLRERQVPVTIGRLAKMAGVGRSHLSQVLNGEREGSETWPLLAKLLTHQEYITAHSFARFSRLTLGEVQEKIIEGEKLLQGCEAREKSLSSTAIDSSRADVDENAWLAMATRAENNRFIEQLKADLDHLRTLAESLSEDPYPGATQNVR